MVGKFWKRKNNYRETVSTERETFRDCNRILRRGKIFEYFFFFLNLGEILKQYKCNRYLGNTGNIQKKYSKNLEEFRGEFWRIKYFLAIFRNEITTILTPSTSEGGESVLTFRIRNQGSPKRKTWPPPPSPSKVEGVRIVVISFRYDISIAKNLRWKKLGGTRENLRKNNCKS